MNQTCLVLQAALRPQITPLIHSGFKLYFSIRNNNVRNTVCVIDLKLDFFSYYYPGRPKQSFHVMLAQETE